MPGDLLPAEVLKSLEKGRLAPLYLFYGPDEFRLEKTLDRIREVTIPESARDFNLEILYGGETEPGDLIIRAQTVPFLAQSRLIIVRRTEDFRADALNRFLPYLESPVESTCLIFISSKTDFKRKFYKRVKASGRAVNFKELKESQIVPWIKKTARELDLDIDAQGCIYLQQIVGNKLRDLHAELEKLGLRYGKSVVGVDQVKELAIHSRIYSIFELMNRFSVKDGPGSLRVLDRYLEEEDKMDAPLRIMGMLNRQIRLLWQAKSIVAGGGKTRDVAGNLNLPHFAAGDFVKQSRHWTMKELEKGLKALYQADGLLKSGSRSRPVLESLILSLCGCTP